METDRYRVEGTPHSPREGYRSRLSDYVNRRDHDFFTIVDAELRAIDGSGRDWQAPVLMLARSQIRLIVPASRRSLTAILQPSRAASVRGCSQPSWPS